VIVSSGQAPASGGQGLPTEQEKAKVANAPPAVLTQFHEPRIVSSTEQLELTTGLLILITATLLIRARNQLGWGQRKKDLARRLRARLKKVDAKVANGDWRGVGVEMTNTVYFILGAVSGEGGANVELEKLLLKAPPSVRRELGAKLSKQMEVFQILSFAPEGIVGQLKEPSELKRHVSEMSKLMEKAVALAMSSEQSGESELNPTAS
jgi:hypothetical protein